VVDFSPSPLPVALRLMEMGVSYFSLSATEFQRDFLSKQLDAGLLAAVVSPTSPLYDRRLATLSGMTALPPTLPCFQSLPPEIAPEGEQPETPEAKGDGA
jgi:hypothetical protein